MQTQLSKVPKFVVPVTVMLSFVSIWKASAIVLCDLAKVSVSALMFDYVLTGPISGVSAGLYLAALMNELGQYFHVAWMHVPPSWFAAAFAAVVTLYFWHANRVDIPFCSFRFEACKDLSPDSLKVEPGCCIVGVDDPGDLSVFDKVLSEDVGEKTIVAICLGSISVDRIEQSPQDDCAIADRVKDVFSEVVFSAEKLGRQLWLGSSRSWGLVEQRTELNRHWKSISSAQEERSILLVEDAHSVWQQFTLPQEGKA